MGSGLFRMAYLDRGVVGDGGCDRRVGQSAGGGEVENVFHVAAEQLADGSGGGAQAAGSLRRVAVEQFAKLADAVGGDVVRTGCEAGGELVTSGAAAAAHADDGRDVRAKQPGEDGALVVGLVAVVDGAAVSGRVVRVLRRQRA